MLLPAPFGRPRAGDDSIKDGSTQLTSRGSRTRCLLGGLLFGATVAAGVLAVGSGQPAAADEHCSVYWTGAVSTTFNVMENWASTVTGDGVPARLPTATDVICIADDPVRAEILYTSLARTVAGIDLSARDGEHPRLVIDGGRLRLGSDLAAYTSVIEDLELRNGAELIGTADYTLTGDVTLTGNALLDGPGTTTLGPDSTTVTDGLVVDNDRQLRVEGQLTYSGCYDYLYLYDGAGISNAGRLTIDTDCDNRIYADGSDGALLHNDSGGVLEILQSTADRTVLDAPLDNHGVVSVPDGSLVVRPSGSSAGSYDLGATAQLLLPGQARLTVGPDTLLGAGTLVASGGTIDVASGVVIERLELAGGSLTGNPTVRNLTGGTGSTFTGGGVLTIPVDGTATLDSLVVNGGSQLINRGSLLHVGCVAPLRLQSGSVLDNAGSFVAGTSCGSSISTDGSAGVQVRNEPGATFTVSQPNIAWIYTIAPALDNQGTVVVTKGQVNVTSTPNLVDGLLSAGRWVAQDGKIQFPGPITANNADLTIGAGMLTPSGDGALAGLAVNRGSLTVARSVVVETDLSNTGQVTVSGQTLSATTYTQLVGTTTVSTGAALVATSDPDAVMIQGGTVQGSGRLSGEGGNGAVDPWGAMRLSAGYKPGPQATLAIRIGVDFDVLTVNGAAPLAGTLALSTPEGFSPPVGSTYPILTSSRVTGTFTAVTGHNLPGDRYFEVVYGADKVTLVVRDLPRLAISDAAAVVGMDGTTPMRFDVALQPAATHDVTVDYRTVAGTALAGEDFVAKSGTLTFPAGTTAASVTVTIARDTAVEPVETFQVVLEQPRGAAVADGSGLGQITHDGAAPTVPVVTGVVPGTVGLGAHEAVLTVTGRFLQPTSTVTVTGTGVVVVDTRYVDTETISLTVDAYGRTTPGVNDVTVTTPGIGSGTCTGCLTVVDKPLPVAAAPALGAGATARTVTVTGSGFGPGSVARIMGPNITVTTAYVSATSLRLTVTVPLTAAVQSYDVRVTNADGGLGTCSGCFSVLAGPTIDQMSPGAIARGQATSVTFVGERLVAGATLAPPSGVSFSNVQVVNAQTMTATATVSANRKWAPNLRVGVTNPAAAGFGTGSCTCLTIATLITVQDAAQSVGTSGPASMMFTVRLDSPAQKTVSVAYRTVAGTATAGADYIDTSGTLTFAPNTTALTVAVTVKANVAAEPTETFTLQLTAPTNAVLSDAVGVGTITHNPGAGTLPVATGLTPNTVGPGAAGRSMTVTGAHFTPTTTVAVSGTGVAVTRTTYVSPTSLSITVDATLSLGAGPRDVTVTTTGTGSTTCAGCLVVTVKPVPTAASPSLAMGATARTVTVTGVGFQPGSTMRMTGNAGVDVLSTAYVSPTTVRLTVTILNTAVVGSYDIRVTNLDGGMGSCTRCFTVTKPPTVLLMVPGVVSLGSTTLVTITGTGFVPGATVVGPDGVTFTGVTVPTPATMTATMTVSPGRGRGSNLLITVVNPVGGGYGEASCRCLTIIL